MSKQNIEIEVPEGFEAKYNPETQKIEMIKKDNKPRTWKEFCKNYHIKDEYWIDVYSEIRNCRDYAERDSTRDKNFCTSKAEAEAFLAMMQLRQLRNVWLEIWYTEHDDIFERENCIGIGSPCSSDEISVVTSSSSMPLSFPTKKMAQDFLDCFRDLIEKAKILL